MQQSCAWQSAESVTDDAHDLRQARALTRPGSGNTGEAFREDPPITVLIPASKASRPKTKLNLLTLPKQIVQPALVLAVVRDLDAPTVRAVALHLN